MPRKKKPKAQGLVQVASHKDLPEELTWYEALDQALMKKYPNLVANTYPSNKGYVTAVQTKDQTTRLMPAQQRVVRAFVDGFMACERSY